MKLPIQPHFIWLSGVGILFVAVVCGYQLTDVLVSCVWTDYEYTSS
jgi:hypothetical protein